MQVVYSFGQVKQFESLQALHIPIGYETQEAKQLVAVKLSLQLAAPVGHAPQSILPVVVFG